MNSKHLDLLKSRQEKIDNFDPDAVGAYNGRLFGLPFTLQECGVVVIPVPWEATVSYRAGTAEGPASVLLASPQLDLYDARIPDAWQLGIGMLPIPDKWQEANLTTRKKARVCIEILENGGDPKQESVRELARAINETCGRLADWVQETATEWRAAGKFVCVLGGEHSSPLGLLRAVAEDYPEFGVLQIDAHADLREAYQGFQYSHASIMHNAIQLPQLKRLVQVGVRDYCKAEADLVAASGGRVRVFEDRALKHNHFEGKSWQGICTEIVDHLPEHVYVSFDIDGLDPALCPNTGTPVPGGLTFEEAFYLLETVVESGRKIIAFDLCEVSPGPDGGEWDAIVGARTLYRLANLAAYSQGLFEDRAKMQ